MKFLSQWWAWTVGGGIGRKLVGFGIPAFVVLFIIAAIAGGSDEGSQDTDSDDSRTTVAASVPEPTATRQPEPTSTVAASVPEPTATKQPEPTKVDSSGRQTGRIGEVVHVGDLDLTIHSVEAFDSKPYNMFNDANVAVSFTAVNARGKSNDTYGFTPVLAFLLVDGNGVGVNPTFACAGCPNSVDSVELVPGGSISGTVYFELASTQWKEIRYQAFLSSNSAVITP